MLAPQKGTQEDFILSAADIVFYGGAAGSGKSHALLLDPLQYIDDPNYYAVMFRQNTTQLDGSLWPAAKAMYAPFNVRVKEKEKIIIFPSGARIKFAYMELEKHADAHQGIEYSAIYWDEFTHFSLYQFNYLRSRMRSKAKNKSYMKATMNPDIDHFVFNWVEEYLLKEDHFDEYGEKILDRQKGCPDRALSGKLRYFVINGLDIVTDWSKEELIKKYPRKKPRSYTFICGTIDDNPILDIIEPDYRETLESLPPVEMQRLRYGNWLARPQGSEYFKREWCEIVEAPPISATRVRSWDTASSLASAAYPDPDWTAGVKMSKDKYGIYYIEDSIRFRDRPAGVQAAILKTAELDGDETKVTVPQDPGGAGKAQSVQYIRKLAEQGNYASSMPTNKNKLTRFAPFSAAAEAGLVKIVRGSWNEPYFSELEGFSGDGKTKDDQADASSDAFITLAQKKHVPTFTLEQFKVNNPFSTN